MTSTHLIHLCSRVHVSYGCLLKHELTCIFRVSPTETSCEKHDHPVDDYLKKCGLCCLSLYPHSVLYLPAIIYLQSCLGLTPIATIGPAAACIICLIICYYFSTAFCRSAFDQNKDAVDIKGSVDFACPHIDRFIIGSKHFICIYFFPTSYFSNCSFASSFC